MKKAIVLLSLLALVAFAGAALAEDKDEDAIYPGGDPFVPGTCPLEDYKSFVKTGAFLIPDNNATGVTLTSLASDLPADGSTIGDVVVDMKATHSWVGDLIIELSYQPSCVAPAIGPAVLVCRPNTNVSTCPRSSGTSTVGCSSNMHSSNTYYWGEGSTGGFLGITPDCGSSSAVNIPGGCYRPQGTPASGLSIFNGLPKGGCWILKVQDRVGADVGSIYQWSVHVRNIPSSTEESTWGGVKGLFQ